MDVTTFNPENEMGQIIRVKETSMREIPCVKYVWKSYEGKKLQVIVPETHDPEFEMFERMTDKQFSDRLGAYASEIKEI